MKKIGILLNPIAGMGGVVGLKGTDGMLEEAARRGAVPTAHLRMGRALEGFKRHAAELLFLTCSGSMGSNLLHELGFNYEVVYTPAEEVTSASDTIEACKKILSDDEVKLLLFCGGDGTARDVYSAVDGELPVLGIPAGVKMHSAVFTVNPGVAGDLVMAFLNGELGTRESEVMDVDEEKYRENQLDVNIYGYMRVPYRPSLVQEGKSVYHTQTEEEAKKAIAKFAGEFMRDGSAYILGAGTTTKAITDELGIDKTLFGVDVVKNGKLILKDVNEAQLLELMKNEPSIKILVTPIGAQGFIFGRGTQQMSPGVIKKVGLENIIIIATPYKLEQTPVLRVDTGNEKLDRELSGYRSVVSGYRVAQRRKIIANEEIANEE